MLQPFGSRKRCYSDKNSTQSGWVQLDLHFILVVNDSRSLWNKVVSAEEFGKKQRADNVKIDELKTARLALAAPNAVPF